MKLTEITENVDPLIELEIILRLEHTLGCSRTMARYAAEQILEYGFTLKQTANWRGFELIAVEDACAAPAAHAGRDRAFDLAWELGGAGFSTYLEGGGVYITLRPGHGRGEEHDEDAR